MIVAPSGSLEAALSERFLPLGRLVASSYVCSFRIASGSGQIGIASELDSKILLLRDLNAIHAGHSLSRNEGKDNFALSVGSDAGKGSVQRTAFPACLFEDIEVPE